MPINYNKLDEGDQLNAASLNDRFSSIGGAATGVNNLGQEDLERLALRRNHVPSLITSASFPNGLSKVGPLLTPAAQQYDAFLNAGVVGVPAAYLTTFGTTGTNPPYGPTGAFDAGWRIPATNGVIADAAEITFPAITATNTSIGNYKGFLVRLGISLDDVIAPGNAGVNNDAPTIVVGIGWTNNSGARAVFDRSIRWNYVHTRVKGSLDTFIFIKPEDIGNTVGIQSVFGVIAGASKNDSNTQAPKPKITFYNIDIIPIRAGDLD